MDIKVNLEGEVFSTLRNEDGSIVKEEYFHNTIMNQSVNLLAKNLCFKNKLPYSALRFTNVDVSNSKSFLYPDGMYYNFNISGENHTRFHDAISDIDGISTTTYPWHTTLMLKNPTLIKNVTMKFTGTMIPHQWWSDGCTPSDYSIQTSVDTTDGQDGTWNTVINVIGDTWYPVSGLRTVFKIFVKTFTIPNPIFVKAVRFVCGNRNTVDYLGVGMNTTTTLVSMYINEGDYGLRRIKVGTNSPVIADGNATLTDLSSPVSLNNGWAFGYTSGVYDMEKDIYFEAPNIIKMRYKWVNTTGAPVVIKEVGAFDNNNGTPTLVSRVLRDTTVNHLQYLDDVYKIRINIVR